MSQNRASWKMSLIFLKILIFAALSIIDAHPTRFDELDPNATWISRLGAGFCPKNLKATYLPDLKGRRYFLRCQFGVLDEFKCPLGKVFSFNSKRCLKAVEVAWETGLEKEFLEDKVILSNSQPNWLNNMETEEEFTQSKRLDPDNSFMREDIGGVESEELGLQQNSDDFDYRSNNDNWNGNMAKEENYDSESDKLDYQDSDEFLVGKTGKEEKTKPEKIETLENRDDMEWFLNNKIEPHIDENANSDAWGEKDSNNELNADILENNHDSDWYDTVKNPDDDEIILVEIVNNQENVPLDETRSSFLNDNIYVKSSQENNLELDTKINYQNELFQNSDEKPVEPSFIKSDFILNEDEKVNPIPEDDKNYDEIVNEDSFLDEESQNENFNPSPENNGNYGENENSDSAKWFKFNGISTLLDSSSGKDNQGGMIAKGKSNVPLYVIQIIKWSKFLQSWTDLNPKKMCSILGC